MGICLSYTGPWDWLTGFELRMHTQAAKVRVSRDLKWVGPGHSRGL